MSTLYTIRFEPQFRRDYKRTIARYPHLRNELQVVLRELQETGRVPDSYSPHLLLNSARNYFNHMEFHLSDGAVDVLVLYMPHRTNPEIRLVRMGSHNELFRGPEL